MGTTIQIGGAGGDGPGQPGQPGRHATIDSDGLHVYDPDGRELTPDEYTITTPEPPA